MNLEMTVRDTFVRIGMQQREGSEGFEHDLVDSREARWAVIQPVKDRNLEAH